FLPRNQRAATVPSRSVPAGRHAPTLAGFGDAEDLTRGRGLVLLWQRQAEEDSPDGVLIAHEGEDAHALAAASADERGRRRCPRDASCPRPESARPRARRSRGAARRGASGPAPGRWRACRAGV